MALVVNPRAGRGRVARELPRLLEALRARHLRAKVHQTLYPGHAVFLARQAALDGAETVVAVGGDGTVNEVVNGLIRDDAAVSPAVLGVVAAGSGCDFARTLDLPKHTGADGLAGVVGPVRPLDVGKVVCSGGQGTVTRYFVNVAEAGLGAATVERADRLPRWLGRSRYMVAFWPTLLRFRPSTVTVRAGDDSHTGRAHNALVANARFFGGGMRVSPHSDPADGVFEVMLNVGPKRQAVTIIPKMFRGTHLPDPRIVQFSAARISIDSEPPVLVETDGELLGATPAEVSVLPDALRVVVRDRAEPPAATPPEG